MTEYLAVIELVSVEVVCVCSGGHAHLNTMCKTIASYMEWNVTVAQYQRPIREVFSRFGTPERTVQPWIYESNILNISKL